jgi:catechol 2,3-dioxygenase-like lactoylglutathione lyase family enzyme
MKVLFVAGFGPIAGDPEPSRRLYADLLGLPFEADGDYLHTDRVDGVRHLAVWPLGQAAQSCFGSERWPEDVPVPQAWIEFEVEDLAAATEEIRAAGYHPLVENRMEPWGQTVTRMLGPEGLLLGLVHTPWLR